MAYNILNIVTAEHDDDQLYPVLGNADSPFPIAFEPDDGGDVKVLAGRALVVHEVAQNGLKKVMRVADIKADIYVTDSRVAVACVKYDKGGGWIGSPGTALMLNAVSKARAAVRRRGKVLVGQVRYPWLAAVGATAKTGWSTDEALRLRVSDASGATKRGLILEVTLPKNIDAASVAAEIARRAASYRLAHDATFKEEERDRFQRMLAAEALRPEPKKFVFHTMPTFWHVSATSNAAAGT